MASVSFEILIRELKIQLAATHYVHKHRAFMTLDHVLQFNICLHLIEEFCCQDFETTSEFSKKTNRFFNEITRKADGYRKEELIAMNTILKLALSEMENHQKRIKVEIEKCRLTALVDDQGEENSLGL